MINQLWWDFLDQHHRDPEAVEACHQQAVDQARIVCQAVQCPECGAPPGLPCGEYVDTADWYHFGRGAAFARTGGAICQSASS